MDRDKWYTIELLVEGTCFGKSGGRLVTSIDILVVAERDNCKLF
jgi:hypothetical protein